MSHASHRHNQLRSAALCGGAAIAISLLAGCSSNGASAPSTVAVMPQSTTLAQRSQMQIENLTDPTYQHAVLRTKPVGYFPLNSVTGGSVGGTYTVSFIGGAQIAKHGAIQTDKRNKFLSLSGTEYATTSLSGNVPGTGSMVAWVNLSELPSSTGNIFYVSGESQLGNDFDLQFQTDNNLYFFTGGGENTEYTTDPSTLVGQWNMIAVTYQGGSSGFRNIYWNGALVSPFSGGVNGNSKTSQFSIGESLFFTGRYFQGGIDAVALWNRALTSQEIAHIFQAAQ